MGGKKKWYKEVQNLKQMVKPDEHPIKVLGKSNEKTEQAPLS